MLSGRDLVSALFGLFKALIEGVEEAGRAPLGMILPLPSVTGTNKEDLLDSFPKVD